MKAPAGTLIELRPFVRNERGLNALWRAGYTNIDDLFLLSNADLLALPSVGASTVVDLRSAVNQWLEFWKVSR